MLIFRRKYLFTLLGLAFAGMPMMGTLPDANAQGRQMPPAVVETAEVEMVSTAAQMTVPGTIISRNDSRIAAEISGRLTWVADPGAAVDAGDPIARIDDRDYRLAVQTQEAEIRRLEAQLTFLSQQLDRLQKLADGNYTPVATLQEAQSNLAMTEQQINQARTALQSAELSLERTVVRAPFPGRVVSRLAQAGEYSTPGREVARLVDTTHVEIRVQAPLSLAPYLKSGQTVPVKVSDEVVDARVRAVIPVGDEVTRTLDLRVVLPENEWMIGGAVQANLPTSADAEMITVPRDALILRPGSTYVWRIDSDGKAVKTPVEVGAGLDERIAVIGELKSGDVIVVRGGERLMPGQPVQVADRQSPSNS